MDTQNSELHGTTIIAAEFDGGVIIGADSRAAEGLFVVYEFLKNCEHVRKQIYIFGSGPQDQVQEMLLQVTLVAKRFEKESDPEKATVLYVANLVSSFITDLKQHYNSYVVAGWDKVRGGQVYNVFMCGFKLRRKVALLGTSSSVLTGYAREVYTENMTEDACMKFVEEGVKLGIEGDVYSGGVIKIFKCAKNGSHGKIIYPTPNGEVKYPGTDLSFISKRFQVSKKKVDERD